jgi:hypothetical protein
MSCIWNSKRVGNRRCRVVVCGMCMYTCMYLQMRPHMWLCVHAHRMYACNWQFNHQCIIIVEGRVPTDGLGWRALHGRGHAALGIAISGDCMAGVGDLLGRSGRSVCVIGWARHWQALGTAAGARCWAATAAWGTGGLWRFAARLAVPRSLGACYGLAWPCARHLPQG